MKKIFPLLMAVIFLFVGCKQDDIPAELTPEQYITEIYNALSGEKISFSNIYQYYFSKTSKELISLDKYTARETEKLDGIKITAVSELTSDQLGDDRYKVTGTLSYIEDGEAKKQPFSEYLIREDGKLKYLYEGIFSRQTYTMPEDVSTLPLHMNRASIYTAEDYTMIEFVMENAGSTAYSVGKDGLNGAVAVETDMGIFSGEISEIRRISREETAELTCKIPNYKGKAQLITVSHLFSVDFRGEIIDTGNGFDYSVQLVDFAPEVTTSEVNA